MACKTIVVMGPTGVGKSSFIRSVLPNEVSNDIQVGHRLQSETSQIQPVFLDNNNVKLKLVDTPGFDDSRDNLTDVDVLQMIATFLTTEHQRQTFELVGLIYVHRISDTRMGATAKRNLRMFQQLCGPHSMGNVVIVTTMWDKVTPEEGSRREIELASSEDLFKPLLTGGAKMAQYKNRESALRVLDYLLGKNSTTLQIVHELVEEKKVLVDTAAGKELQADIRHLMKRRMKDIQDLEEEIRAAAGIKDRRTVDEITGEKRDLEEERDKLRAELGKLGHSLGHSFIQYLRTCVISLLRLPRRSNSFSFSYEWRLE